MPSQSPKIAFAGLGAMGCGMAAHLVKCGFQVTGFDVYRPALERFTAEGPSASIAKTPFEAVQDVEFFVCMVANSMQATPLLFDDDTGAVKGLRNNATIIMCSTVAPAYIEELQRRLKEIGRSDILLIDSPVSGGAGRAADGTLSIFASGAREHLENARAILECMSGKLYEIPGGLGGGSKTKLIHQIFAGVNIAMASEAMGLAAVAGLDTRDVFEKGIITQTSRQHSFPLPLLSTAEQLYLSAISAGWGAEDDCVLVRLYLPPGQGDLVARQADRPDPLPIKHNITLETIEDIIVGVHTAAIAEAMGFCEYLGIETDLMYDIVSHAAGTSRVFETAFQGMKEKGWRIEGVEVGGEVGERLVSAFVFVTVVMRK
ncbi:MAG: hypothetical protein Q9166_001005 [cf. Caloplaca sp. 2 TL-2023]